MATTAKSLSRHETVAIIDRKQREREVMKGIRNAALIDDARAPGHNSSDLPVSSRRDALERLRKSVGSGEKPTALLTGEPGTGKTWLWRRLVAELANGWRWLSVDMSPALDALEFLRLVAHGLEIAVADRLGAARHDMARALQDDAIDGQSWLLVVENAQNTPAQVWTEIQAVVRAMEANAGFAAVLLVGPTSLTRHLSSRALNSLATRITTHVHLLPLDLDESIELAHAYGASGDLDREVMEELHRDARGNPRRLQQLLRNRSWATDVPAIAGPPPVRRRLPEPSILPGIARSEVNIGTDRGESVAPTRESAVRPRTSAVAVEVLPTSPPALVPSRPPLRIEEGLIEVGWGGSLEAEAAVADSESVAPLLPAPLAAIQEEPPREERVEEPNEELPSEEMIEDHYAALQAWTEWAKNRGRTADQGGSAGGKPVDQTQESTTTTTVRARDEHVPVEEFPAQGLRAEHQHEHAPYSQLFSRLRQSR